MLDAIESKVKVTRLKSGKLKRSASAEVGAITAGGGDAQSLEDLDGLEIPGLLKIETGLRKKIKDGIRIVGGPFGGGEGDSHGDHRIAMSFAMAALRASAPITIRRCANVATSFPGFADLARGAGLDLEVHASKENA